MGGNVSCISARSGSTATLIDGDGNLRRVEAPVSAAEVMFDEPGCAIASAEDVLRTRRAVAITADEELRPGLVYMLFPVSRNGSRVSDQQKAALESALKGGRKGRRSKESGPGRAGDGKVFPSLAKLAAADADLGSFAGGCSQSSTCVRRPWSPVLDAIYE